MMDCSMPLQSKKNERMPEEELLPLIVLTLGKVKSFLHSNSQEQALRDVALFLWVL
jgi:hypothetical protein